jgi:hypothetical protein
MVASTNCVELCGKSSETIRANAAYSDTERRSSRIGTESMSRRQQCPRAFAQAAMRAIFMNGTAFGLILPAPAPANNTNGFGR